MNRSLDTLSSQFQPVAFELLARLTERVLAVMIVQTLRTLEEHSQNVAAGTSRTSNSKHVARRLRGVVLDGRPGDLDKCDAIDLCPYAVYLLHGPDKLQWNPADPAFRAIGEEAERLDLRWGGRWFDPVDPGHCELILTPYDRTLATGERLRLLPGVHA